MDENDAYALKWKIDQEGWQPFHSYQFARCFSPKLELRNWGHRPILPSPGPKLQIRDMANFSVAYSKGIFAIEIPDNYLQTLIPKLRAALSLAEELETEYSVYMDICSIEPDNPRQPDDGDSSFYRTYGVSGMVIYFVNVFKRLIVLAPDVAIAEMAAWPRQSAIFDRIRIWAFGNLDLIQANEFGRELLAISDANFWPFKGERDLLLGLVKKWAQFDDDTRASIERRILRGPPRRSKTKQSDHLIHSAYRRLNWLNWLKSQGCEFGFDITKVNQKLRESAPTWQTEFAAKAAESHDSKSGTVRTETDFEMIAELQPSEVIPYISKMKTDSNDRFVRLDPFQGLCRERPKQALEALRTSIRGDLFPTSFWDTFLNVELRKLDTSEIRDVVAEMLLDMPHTEFIQIIRSGSDWFKLVAGSLNVERTVAFNSLWDKFIRALRSNLELTASSLVRSQREPDWVMEAINSAPGNLAQLAIEIKILPNQDQNKGFPVDWISRIDDLLSQDSNARLYMLVFIGFHLNWMFHIDPKWVEKNVLVRLDCGSNKDESAAIMAGFFWRSQAPSRSLFIRLKSHLLNLGTQNSEQRSGQYENLAGMLLIGWESKEAGEVAGVISNSEMADLIKNVSSRLRQQLIWCLKRWAKGDDQWASRIAPFLRDVWPKQREIRTPEMSSTLCELALEQENQFPEVAKLVSKLITKVNSSTLFTWALEKEKEHFALKHPDELLDLLSAALPENSSLWPYGAEGFIRQFGEKVPAIRADPRYISLQNQLS